MIRTHRKNRAQSAFTLLELLVAMALTAILLGLIFGPVIQSFNLTNRARTQIESQTAARDAMSLVTRLLTSAVFVYDNAQTPLNMWFANEDGEAIYIPTTFTMVEYVTPARQLDQHPGSLPIDPTTGEPIYDAGQNSGETGFAVPLAPGRKLGRIWLGLIKNGTEGHTPAPNDNTQIQQNGKPVLIYANRFENPRLGNDNRYTVYRAEAVAFVPDSDPNSNGRYVPDLRLFHTSDDTKDGEIRLHDPNFFYDNSLAGGNEPNAGDPDTWGMPGWRDLNGDKRVQIAENWRTVASPIIPTDKGDMASLDRDPNSYDVVYANGRPTVRPLMTFTPTFLQNDPGTATSLESAANESPNPAPTTYTSQQTHWANPFRVIVYRNPGSDASPLTLNPLDFYQTTGDGQIFHYNAVPGQAPSLVEPGDVGPNPDPITGFWRNRNPLFAFSVDSQRGLVNMAYPQWALINDGVNQYPARYSPATVNQQIAGPFEKRYLDLRVLDYSTWDNQLLTPAAAISPLGQFATPLTQAPRVRIVPGSEKVFGPDQRLGPNYGHRVQYTRVAANAGMVGLNEYKINYENVPNAAAAGENDPRVRIGYIEFNSQWDSQSAPNVPLNPAQPAQLNSLPVIKWDTALGGYNPSMFADPIEISYQFQMNRPNDVVKIDYLTRSLMNVSMEARLYDRASGRPQSTSLTNKLKVRNLQR